MNASRFPSFFGPLESSQSPNSCSILFPWLSGFCRVVKNIYRLSQTQFVAVFREQGRFRKIRNNWLKLTFQRIQKTFFAISSWTGLKTSVFCRSLCPKVEELFNKKDSVGCNNVTLFSRDSDLTSSNVHLLVR